MMAKPYEQALAIFDERRQTRAAVPPAGKGRPPPRQCPHDFDVVFVEIGRDNVEIFYRASRITVNRWLDERGKHRLIALRAQFVIHMRCNAREPKPERPRAPPVRDRRRISPTLARHAAHYLRSVRNGGWIVSLTSDGDWWVGCRRRSPAELLDLAVAKGFDPHDRGIAGLLDRAYGEPDEN